MQSSLQGTIHLNHVSGQIFSFLLRSKKASSSRLWYESLEIYVATRTLKGCPMDYPTLPIGFQTGHPLEGPGRLA